jgi:DNA polymerase-3 subunit delta
MYPEQALKQIEKGTIRPIYLLHGDEYFYTRAIVAALRAQVLKENDPAMCLSEYDGAEAAAAQVLDDLRTMTFFGGTRLVVVENADRFLRDNKDLLARYAKSPSKTGCLVLLCESKPDGRLAFVRAVSKKGAIVQCSAPKGGKLAYWVKDRARTLGKAIGEGAASLLIDIVGADLAQLDSHLRMLVTYVGGRNSITEQDVATTVEEARATEIWDLMDGVAGKDGKMALEALDRLLPKAGMEAARLSLIGGTLLRLRNVKKVMEHTGSEASVATTLKMHPYFARKSVEQAKKFTSEELAVGVRRAFEADILIKSNRMKPRLAVEKLIVELCT